MKNLNQRTEDEIALDNIKSGKVNEGYTYFYNRYYSYMKNQARAMLKRDDWAEDAAQDVLMKLFNCIEKGKYEQRENISMNAWLTRVTANHCMDVIKKNKNNPEISNGISLDSDFGWENETESFSIEAKASFASLVTETEEEEREKTQYQFLLDLVQSKLTKKEREVYELKYMNQMSGEEIAEQLKYTHAKVRVMFFRIKKKLTAIAQVVKSNNYNYEVAV